MPETQSQIDWDQEFSLLPQEELDKVALLRVIECSNGVIQHLYRDGHPKALPLEQTRDAMSFSMGCMISMSIPLKNTTITFSPETEGICRKVRELYVSGAKRNNSKDWEQFLVASSACIRAVGSDRIEAAKQLAKEQIDVISPECIDWGVDYIRGFVGWA